MEKYSILYKVFRHPFGKISIGYILLVTFCAVFASVLAPDTSPNANQMHVSIHSKAPGFSSLLLLVPNAEGDIIEELPISDFYWEGDRLYYRAVGVYKADYQTLAKDRFPSHLNREKIVQQFIASRTFYLGTDKFGRDLLSRMMLGARISLSIGLVAVLISLIVGIVMGGLGGLFGGRVDAFILWLINVVWSIPSLLMIIAITLALGKGFWQVFIAVGLTMWVEVARLVRGQVLSIKEQTYIQAAKGLAYSPLRIFIFHIFPLVIPSLIVISTANFASAILIESGLSFLGIGAQPPIPSWGGMIKDHFRYILLGKAYLAIIPGLAIMSLVLAFMVLGNVLRDALDVKS